MTANENELADKTRLADDTGNQNATVTYEASDDESMAHAVAAAVGSADGTTETDLRPLYSVVDPDALDAIFAAQSDGTPRDSEGRVTFEYGSRRISVESDGTVFVY